MATAKNEVFVEFWYENCYLEGRNEPVMRGDKNLVERGYCSRISSSGGMNKIFAHLGTAIFS